MDNKLGLDDFELESLQDKLYELKLSLLSDKMTFNSDGFNLKYLKGLHDYLFGDTLYNADKLSKRIDNEDEIDKKISDIVDMISYQVDIELVKEAIDDLINMQIFDDGNNRTINAFFRNIIISYNNGNSYYQELLDNIGNHRTR
jgi:fido (protein-threonine AMPylation protein)